MLIDRRRLAPNGSNKPRIVAVGPEAHHQVLVIDDFFVDPSYVRELALSLDFADVRGTWPGYEARVSVDVGAVLTRVRAVVPYDIRVFRQFQNAFVFSMADERVAPALRHYPHPHADKMTDDGGTTLAAMVYLNLPEHCRGGTGFFRHRETELVEDRGEISPGLARYMVKHGIGTVTEAYEHMIALGDDTRARLEAATGEWGMLADSNELWERTALVEMKWNRFVLFDSSLFHNPCIRSGEFGHDRERRRLTLTTFFEVEDEPLARVEVEALEGAA